MGLRKLVTRWSVRDIARTQLRLLKRIQSEYPSLSESDIATLLFERRIGKLYSPEGEEYRKSIYLAANGIPQSLREACHAIAIIEFRIHPEDDDNVAVLTGLIDKELIKLGYLNATDEKTCAKDDSIHKGFAAKEVKWPGFIWIVVLLFVAHFIPQDTWWGKVLFYVVMAGIVTCIYGIIRSYRR